VRLEAGPDLGLDLDVVGYQFATAEDRFDRNWLVIRGLARWDDLEWTFQSSCLLTDEARELGHWLRHTTDLAAHVEELTFLEPNLWFDVAERDEATVRLKIGLDYESRPPAALVARDVPVTLDLPMSTTALQDASDVWLQALAEYPER
jgi:hypothetical protein